MKVFFRKITRVKKCQAIKKAMPAGAVGWALKYGAINANANLFVDSSSGAVIGILTQQNKTPEALKSSLEI
jgi:hypothetical protein